MARALRLFAAVPQQRRLLQRGFGSSTRHGAAAAAAAATAKGDAMLFLFPIRFVNKAERFQERMLQGTGKKSLSAVASYLVTYQTSQLASYLPKARRLITSIMVG